MPRLCISASLRLEKCGGFTRRPGLPSNAKLSRELLPWMRSFDVRFQFVMGLVCLTASNTHVIGHNPNFLRQDIEEMCYITLGRAKFLARVKWIEISVFS